MSVKQYLADNGYSSIEDWAIDSDFRHVYIDGSYVWVNEEGHQTDLVSYLSHVLEEMT